MLLLHASRFYVMLIRTQPLVLGTVILVEPLHKAGFCSAATFLLLVFSGQLLKLLGTFTLVGKRP